MKTKELNNKVYEIVGHCTQCGCPIYGNKTIRKDDEDICIIFSCGCFPEDDD